MNTRPLKYNLRSGDQLYFIHIPKTAGTTLRAILETRFRPEEIGPFVETAIEDQMLELDNPESWSGYRLLTGHFDYNIYKVLPRKPVYIIMLRHPVHRTVSVYEHVTRDPNHDLHRLVTEQRINLLDFLQLPEAKNRIYNRQTYMIAGVNLSNRKKTLSEQALLEIARVHLDEFAFFGLTERFEESLSLLTYTFGWQPIKRYEALNVSPPSSKQVEITPEVSKAIMACTQLDMELYAYAEQLFEARLQQMLAELQYQARLLLPTRLRPVSSRLTSSRLAQIRQRLMPDGSPLGNFYLQLRRRVLGW